MSIDNYEESSDPFTWPNNPNVFDDTIDPNYTVTKLPYGKAHIFITAGGIDPKSMILTGHFNEADSADKRADYNTLANHVIEAKLKKLFFASDRFYISLGKQIKQTNTGGRTGFIDYIATFEAPIGILFGSAQKSSGTNGGTTQTFIEKITATNSSGNPFTITDNHDNGITITPAGSGAIIILLITLKDIGSGTKAIKLMYVTVDGTESNRKTASGKNSMFLRLDPAENVSTISISGDISSSTEFFRDGYLG